jgi:hypothetical protein
MPGTDEKPHGSVKARGMEYRGKQYSVVMGIDGLWKWSVTSLSARPNLARKCTTPLESKPRSGRSTSHWRQKSSACEAGMKEMHEAYR